jgi:hypothetical protein
MAKKTQTIKQDFDEKRKLGDNKTMVKPTELKNYEHATCDCCDGKGKVWIEEKIELSSLPYYLKFELVGRIHDAYGIEMTTNKGETFINVCETLAEVKQEIVTWSNMLYQDEHILRLVIGRSEYITHGRTHNKTAELFKAVDKHVGSVDVIIKNNSTFDKLYRQSR